jgi:hypothetical protein
MVVKNRREGFGMKVSQKRLMLLFLYAGLCLLFWTPHLRSFITHEPIGLSNMWDVLLIPMIPVVGCLLHAPFGRLGALLFPLIYLALLFWPLLVIAIKPDLWGRSGWRSGIGLYSIGFALAMIFSSAFAVFIYRMEPGSWY